jgi:FkbM family methyltransferase
MLMNLDELAAKYGLVSKVIGILHGGAHLAEEAPDYARVFPAAPIWWIEANTAVTPQIIAVITKYENQKLIEALLCDVDNEHRQFNITNYDGMSSSLLEFGTHPEFSPDTVFTHSVSLATRTLDSLVEQYHINANMLVMDLQGAEGLALAGAQLLLPHLVAVMLEVNKAEVYRGCAKVWDLDDILLVHGLKRMETHWVGEQGWGDSLYVKC